MMDHERRLKAAAQAMRSCGAHGVAAITLTLLAVIVLLAEVRAVVRAMLLARIPEAAGDDADEARIRRHALSIEQSLAQIAGRSMFFTPPPPPAASPAVRREAPAEGPPTRYEGPALVAIVNGAAWFADGRRLEVGEESDALLRVIALNPPWGARVFWKGAVFEAPLFDRTTARFLAPPSEPSSEAPSAGTPPSEPRSRVEPAPVDLARRDGFANRTSNEKDRA